MSYWKPKVYDKQKDGSNLKPDTDEELYGKDDGIELGEMKINDTFELSPRDMIRKSLLLAQMSLYNGAKNNNLENGIMTNSLFIDEAETIARSAGILSDEYNKEILEFQNNPEFINNTNVSMKMAMLSDKKKYLILKEIFDTKGTDMSGKL